MSNDPASVFATVRVADLVHWYPAIEQQRMMTAWLEGHRVGTWSQSGLITADDRTVITPNSDMNYGYCWFNLSNGPMVIDLPTYRRYLSLSVFDMAHFVPGVFVSPTLPIHLRLPSQPAPAFPAHDVVLQTVTGLAFLRMAIPEPSDEAEVLELAGQIRTRGGDGNLPYLIPDFTDDEYAAALDLIRRYALAQTSSLKMFGTREQGGSDLDRCAGVFLGQLGIPAAFVQYSQYVELDGSPLGGKGSYEITVDPHGMVSAEGYWWITVYDMSDRYLISNTGNRYSITSYAAVPNPDGSVTVRINRDGIGANALPTAGKHIYAIMRAYQPRGIVTFPPIRSAR